MSSGLLYLLYFLPTSVNTAWLSIASGLGVLVVPASYGLQAHMDAFAAALAVAVTCAGRQPLDVSMSPCHGILLGLAVLPRYSCVHVQLLPR